MTITKIPLNESVTPIALTFNVSAAIAQRNQTSQYLLDKKTANALVAWLKQNQGAQAEVISNWIGKNASELTKSFGHATLTTFADGEIVKEWSLNGSAHRIGKPARIITKPFGAYHEEWRKNGPLHREGGPALIHIDKDWNEGYHRDELYYIEEYQQNGRLSNPTGGPVRIYEFIRHGYQETLLDIHGKEYTLMPSVKRNRFPRYDENADNQDIRATVILPALKKAVANIPGVSLEHALKL